IKYQDGEQAYILAPQRLAAGDQVIASEHADVKPGNAMPIANIPVGTIVDNIEIKIGKGGQVARSAGSYAQIAGRDQDYVILRLSSGEQRLVHGGRTKGGKHWSTPWGIPTKGKKTRKNKRTTKFIVASRHDRKKPQQ